MRSTKKIPIILTALVIPFLLLSSTITSSAKMSVRIGLTLPMTGPATGLGFATLEGVKLAVKEINIHGGILGMPVETIVLDSFYDPSQSKINFQKPHLKQKCTCSAILQWPIVDKPTLQRNINYSPLASL